MKLIVPILAVFLFILAGSALAQQATPSSTQEVNGYTLIFSPEQSIAGQGWPLLVEVSKDGAPVTGLTVKFEISNSTSHYSDTENGDERTPGQYDLDSLLPDPGTYEVKVSFTDQEKITTATFDVVAQASGNGCKPGQAGGCAPSTNGIPGIENYIGGAAIVLIIIALAFFGFMKKNWKVAGILVATIAIAAILGYSLVVTILSGAASSGIVTCVSPDKCFYTAHIHAYVPVTTCGQDFRLPIETGSLQGPHTHEEKNIIHWHDRLPYDNATNKILNEEPLTLGAFFKVMDVPFSSNQINTVKNGDSCPDGSTASLKMLVNGKSSTEFGNYRWHDHDVVVLVMDGRSAQEVEQELQSHPIPFPVLGRE